MRALKNHSDFTVEAKIDHLPEELRISVDQSTANETAYSCFLDNRKLAVLFKDSYGLWVQRWGRLDDYSFSSLASAIEAH